MGNGTTRSRPARNSQPNPNRKSHVVQVILRRTLSSPGAVTSGHNPGIARSEVDHPPHSLRACHGIAASDDWRRWVSLDTSNTQIDDSRRARCGNVFERTSIADKLDVKQAVLGQSLEFAA